MSNRKLILVTNDDGYSSEGIAVLTQMVRPLGDVVVVAPETAQSGMSHAITSARALHVQHRQSEPGYEVYSVDGTPVDCIKVAMNHLKLRQPDLVVSGINHGSNSSVSALYSGTIGAAMEGCMYNMPSIGFSHLDYSPHPDFSAALRYAPAIIRHVLEHGLPWGSCLNVNLPNLPLEQVRGVRVARQCNGLWHEEFDVRTGADGRTELWLGGRFENLEPNAPDTDEYLLSQGYITVVPLQADLTMHTAIDAIKILEVN